MYTYVRTYIIYIHTYILHTYTHTHPYIHTYMHTYTRTYIRTYIYIITYTRTYIRTYIYIITYIRTYTRIHNTYIHTYKMNININPNFTAMVTGRGKTRAYLHRFQVTENATCPCNKGDQPIDHLLSQCTLLQTQREILSNNVLKSGNWPVSKEELITKPL